MKNVHERERKSRLQAILHLFEDPEILRFRQGQLSNQEILSLILSNGIATSIKRAKDYLETLKMSNKLTLVPGSIQSGTALFELNPVVRASSIPIESMNESEKKEIEWLNQIK